MSIRPSRSILECCKLDCVEQVANALGASVPEADIFLLIQNMIDAAIAAIPATPVVVPLGIPFPENVRFVAESWSTPTINPDFQFTTIDAAYASILAAEGGVPSSTEEYTIYIYPGNYTIPALLLSNIALVGVDREGVILTGATAWNAGAGANAPLAALAETITLRDVTLNGSLVFDSTAKTAGTADLIIEQSSVTGALTFTGGAVITSLDTVRIIDSIIDGSITQTEMFVQITSSQANLSDYSLAAVTVPPPNLARLEVTGEVFTATTATFGSGLVRVTNSRIDGAWVASGGAQLQILNDSADSTWALNLITASTAHIFDTKYVQANLTSTDSTGTADREYVRLSAVLAADPTIIPIVPPFITNNYFAAITPTSASGAVADFFMTTSTTSLTIIGVINPSPDATVDILLIQHTPSYAF